MASDKTSARTRSKAWSVKFSFPIVGTHEIGVVTFFWDGDDWKFTGKGDVWVMPASFDMIPDPITQIIPLKTGGVKIYSKQSVAFTIQEEDRFSKVVYLNKVYYCMSVPSVYNVWIGVKSWKVLGFLGYCEEDKTAVLCTITGDGHSYGAMSLNGAREFSGEDLAPDMPGYSHPEFILKKTREEEEMARKVKLAKSFQNVDKTVDDFMRDNKMFKPAHSREYIKDSAEEVKRIAEAGVRAVKDPTLSERVEVYAAGEGELKRRTLRRASIDKPELGVTTRKGSEPDPVEAVRKKLHLKPGDPFPMPINTLEPKTEIKFLEMPRADLVDGEDTRSMPSLEDEEQLL